MFSVKFAATNTNNTNDANMEYNAEFDNAASEVIKALKVLVVQTDNAADFGRLLRFIRYIQRLQAANKQLSINN